MVKVETSAETVILLGTYNGEPFLKEQVDFILGQSYSDWILLIHDDGSTDRTVRIIKEYTRRYPGKIVFVDDRIVLGSAVKNFSHLVEIARKDFDFKYLSFSDQDDVWLPEKLEKSIKRMRELEEKYGKDIPLLVYTDLKVVNKKLNLTSLSMWKDNKINPWRNQTQMLILRNFIPRCTVFDEKNCC